MDAITRIEGFDLKKGKELTKSKIPKRFMSIFDTIKILTGKGSTLFEQGAYLRLREEGGKCELILKIPLNSRDGLKQERELSVPIERSEFGKVKKMLLESGLVTIVTQEKRRISYSYPKLGVRFDVDNWPGVPTYLEVEGRDADTIAKGLALIGFSMKDATSATGREIFEGYGVDPRNLKFGKNEEP